MREIKFRVWDGKQMHDRQHDLFFLHYAAIQTKNTDCVVMQYIGKNDCNENEIFEGDVITFKANYTSKEAGYLDGVIEWDADRCGFAFKAFVNGEYYDLVDESDEDSYQWIILGNIYQYPNLPETFKPSVKTD